jgi:Fur family ferric uptake transcriptional regulator
VAEFVDASIETRQDQIARKLGFELSAHSLVMYGRCQQPDCARRKKPGS